MYLNSQHCLRLLALSRKRIFIDVFCWIIVYLLVVGFNTIHLWNHFEKGFGTLHEYKTLLEFITLHISTSSHSPTWIEAFGIVLKISLLYTLASVVVVYFNLEVLKKYILDRISPIFLKYSLYIISVIVFSLVFANFLGSLIKQINLWRFDIDFPLNVVINFALCLVSTGLVRVHHLRNKTRGLHRIIKKKEHLLNKLKINQEEALPIEMEISQNHIKIGNKTKYHIIKLEDIIYIEAQGKEPAIHTSYGRYYGNFSINDYEKNLPNNLFIRIHRKYIIAKSRVFKRDKKLFILYDNEQKIKLPIGESFLSLIEKDTYLGFHVEHKSIISSQKTPIQSQ